MKRKFTLLVTAAVAVVAFAAIPAMASAAPTIDFSKPLPLSFSGSGGASVLRAEGLPEVKCSSVDVSGTWTTDTTGEIKNTFTGCKVLSIFSCTSTGQSTGTIVTGTLPFHLKYIAGFTKTTGVLITPPANGIFAQFSCAGGLATAEVKGNGVIGHVSAPACNESSTNATIGLTASGTTQTYTKVEGDTTVYGLTNNGKPASEEATATTTLAEGATGQLTCL